MEDLAYRRLLDLAYSTELPITLDIKKLSRLIYLRDNEAEIKDVLDEFFDKNEDGYINNRVLKEMDEIGDKSEKAKLSADKRWERFKIKQSINNNNANANANNNAVDLCELNANASNNHSNASKSNAFESKNDATQDPRPKTQDPALSPTVYKLKQEPVDNSNLIAKACGQLSDFGVKDINQKNTRLADLIHDGTTLQQIANAAAESPGKCMNYILAKLEGQRSDQSESDWKQDDASVLAKAKQFRIGTAGKRKSQLINEIQGFIKKNDNQVV